MPDQFSVPEEMLVPIRAQVEANIAAQLGVQELDAEAKLVVDERVKAAIGVQLERNLEMVAGQAVSGSNIGVGGASRGQTVSESLGVGLENVRLVSEDQKYLDLLQQSARMTKAKFDALVAAGFTQTQAFRLVEAETVAKSGRAR